MAWTGQQAQESQFRQAECMRSASGGFSCPPPAYQQLQTAVSAPAATLANIPQGHACTRFCEFQHSFGNLYVCKTSGTHHVCDQTCRQRVQVDPYTSVCRLSRKLFNTPVPAARQKSLKRMSEEALMEGQHILESSEKRHLRGNIALQARC